MRRLAIVLVACLMSGISSAQDVRTDHMPGRDFTQYHTYKWKVLDNASYPDHIMDVEIRRAVNAQLATKGIRETEEEKADLLAIYQISVDSATNAWMLALYLYDPAKQQLLWAGYVSEAFDLKMSQQENREQLNKTMQNLLKNYPPHE